MKFQKVFEELRKLNPWPVEYLPVVEDYIESVLGPHGKENRLLLELLELTVEKLETFPPDPDFFEEPRPWFQDVHIWATLTHRHKKVTLMAHYRQGEHKCVIIEMKIK
jgi:hypothetical protein